MSEFDWEYDRFQERVAEFARDRDDVRAVIVFGSRAREDRPADEWSDVDLILVTTAADRYLQENEWLAELGDPWLYCRKETPVGGFQERHVLFDDGLEADLVPISLDILAELDELPTGVLALLARGNRFLVDKDGLEGVMADLVADFDVEAHERRLPDREAFHNQVHEAYYRAFWSAKKLRRGELWSAKWGIDASLKYDCLLPMLRWHAVAVHDRAAWHAGRFLEEWADERALEELTAAFGTYDERDCWEALFATLAVFRWVTDETASALDVEQPATVEERTVSLIEGLAPDDRSR